MLRVLRLEVSVNNTLYSLADVMTYTVEENKNRDKIMMK
jgi:hypothetical protein